ncbi:mtDNA inheritance, partitioning of the mitochondrial organelle [Polyrhizophydium stewartii]|uniref:MtDNA inheritance, partitioning of the mitochondrial organelle n=1 Tax=Polyrhizophydium stewartii TaxID=2732419 RepID=A0ABR4MWW0_9FUNG
MQVFESDPAPSNAFLESLNDPAMLANPPTSFSAQLSQAVRVWSDFNAPFYHPKTIFELLSHTHNDENNRFLTFSRGREVFDELDMINDLVDERIRFFMEEADSPQGFQAIVDTFDGFSGLSAAVLETLAEEYPKKARIVFGLALPDTGGLSNTSTYAWSGYVAAGLDTLSLPFRLKTDSRLDMHDLASLLNPRAETTAAALSLSLPVPLPADRSAPLEQVFSISSRGRYEHAWDLTLGTPYDAMDRDALASLSVFRGVAAALRTQELGANELPHTQTQVRQILAQFARDSGPAFAQSVVAELPFPVHASFPQLFAPTVTAGGLVHDSVADGKEHDAVTQCAVHVRAHTGPALRPLFERAIQSLDISPRDGWLLTAFGSGTRFGLERSDFAAAREDLETLCEAYGGEPE